MERSPRHHPPASHPGLAPGIQRREPHGGLHIRRERDGQAGHLRLRQRGPTLPVPKPAQAEHEGAGEADAASRLHARALHRPDAARAGDAGDLGRFQAESKGRESFGGARPADAVDPAESLPGEARQRLREECAVDRVGVLQADQPVY